MELFANNPSTTLNGSINNSTTSVVVTSAAAFPATGNFRIIIDSEIMEVTSVSSNTFTVATRGSVDSSSAASHSSGATVTGVLTRDALAAFRSDTISTGSFASIPAAGAAGRLYYATDGPPIHYIDNGTNWIPFCNGNIPIVPANIPAIGSFTWVNQGTSTAVSTYNGLYLSSATLSMAALEQAWVSGTNHTCIMCCNITGNTIAENAWMAGFTLRAAASNTKVVFIGAANNNPIRAQLAEVATTSSTSWTPIGSVETPSVYLAGNFVWMKLFDDGTNWNFYVSRDAITWDLCLRQSNTIYLSTAATTIGFGVLTPAAALGLSPALSTGMHVMSWAVTN